MWITWDWSYVVFFSILLLENGHCSLEIANRIVICNWDTQLCAGVFCQPDAYRHNRYSLYWIVVMALLWQKIRRDSLTFFSILFSSLGLCALLFTFFLILSISTVFSLFLSVVTLASQILKSLKYCDEWVKLLIVSPGEIWSSFSCSVKIFFQHIFALLQKRSDLLLEGILRFFRTIHF